MNLNDFVQFVLRRGWVAIGLALIGAAGAFAFVQSRVPVYEAVSRVRIEAARPADFGQTQAINGVLRSYAADAATVQMAETVLANLQDSGAAPPGEELNVEVLLANAGASADISTREVQIKYRSPDPAWAERVSSVWADVFVESRRESNLQLDERERVFAEQRDATTHTLYSPRRKLWTAAGAAGGLALGALLALALEYLSAARIRGRDDAALTGVGPLLGQIPGKIPSRVNANRGFGLALIKAVGVVLVPIAVAALIGGGLAYGLSSTRTTIYRARTRVAIEPSRTSDWGQTQAIREIMRGYSEDIATLRMAGQVSERLQLDKPANVVLEQVSVAPNEELYEIWIDVRDRDALTAGTMSRTWAEIFAENRSRANQELDARDRIYARTRDRTTTEVYVPKPMSNGLAGAVVGLVAGSGAVLLVRRRNAPLSDAETTAALSARPLGKVPVKGPAIATLSEDPTTQGARA